MNEPRRSVTEVAWLASPNVCCFHDHMYNKYQVQFVPQLELFEMLIRSNHQYKFL